MAKEKQRKFECDDIPQRCFRFFECMKNKKELCDITFRLGNESISAHRIIITAVIPYFRDILSNKCAQEEEEGIILPDIDSKAFKCLIEFAYTCQVVIDKENVRNVLVAACRLGVEEVREACCDFLTDSLEPENVLHIRQLACDLNCSELMKDTDCYVRENFGEICQTRDFLDYPLNYVQELLDRDDLCADDEEQIFEAVLKWVKYSMEDPNATLAELIRRIRMPLLEPLCLTKIVEREEIIRTSALCRDLIDEAKNYHLFPELRKSVCSFTTEPRKSIEVPCVSENDDVRSFCKLNAELKFTVQHFDFEKEIWHTKDNYAFYEDGGSAAELHSKLYYFFWGYTLQYDQATNKYEMLSNVPTPRSCMKSVSLKNRIYVCGGYIGGVASNGVGSNALECFDPEKDEWTKLRSMQTSRWAASVVPLGEYIYVLGGRDHYSVHDCVERYDPVTDKWRTMSPMLTKRSSAGASALNGKIYVCGGNAVAAGPIGTATAEVYDPIKNTWKFISPMKAARIAFTLLSCRGKLFALEGEDDKGTRVRNFEFYGPEADEWTHGHSTDEKYFASGDVVM